MKSQILHAGYLWMTFLTYAILNLLSLPNLSTWSSSLKAPSI